VAGEPPVIFGTNYPTPDGTCIRDYVDVRDVARAHLEVANSRKILPAAMNIGTGQGISVREVIKLLHKTKGIMNSVVIEESPRIGDPSFLCADVSQIERAIGFRTKYSIELSIENLISTR
jgi:UDP-glucose 4-epimerase